MRFMRSFVHMFGGSCTNFRTKRITQVVIITTLLIYMTVLLYQNVYGFRTFNNVELNVDELAAVDYRENTIPPPEDNGSSMQKQHLNHRLKEFRMPPNSNDNVIIATETTKEPSTTLSDIFISVKTGYNYHETRLALILQTWFRLAAAQTWFFTDTDDDVYQQKSNGHLINTKCPMGHSRKALCCKMSVEFDTFLESGKKWFCHFDDDNYVNIPKLVELLNNYSPAGDWYLGKPSIASPLEIYDDIKTSKNPQKKISFVFATGGAGICLSRALTLKLIPIAGYRRFESIADRIGLPDDVTMGYIIEHLLKVPLTVIDTFHSHLEPMEFLRSESFKEQITFSYANIQNDTNTIQIDGFNRAIDPTRFYTLHCHLFPHAKLENGPSCLPTGVT